MAKSSQTYQFGESTVRVELANIIDATTQVIVSSDDDQLTMSGGVSRDLLHAGGDAIREDANKQRPATVGQVVVTTAGRLEAKHIFHAITRHDGKPREEDPERNRETIASATQQCLQLLNRMNLTSIAFPALGAGYAGFKVEDVAVQMAEEVIKYLHFAKSPLSIEIYLRPEDVGQDVEFREFFNRFDERTGLTYKVVRDHAVVMIHGIRTDAAWFERLRNLLMKGDLQAAPVSAGYDYFGPSQIPAAGQLL